MPAVERIDVGTGSPEGSNGAYLLPDRGVLVDPGPPTDDAWAALTGGLDAAGHDPGVVDRVVVTHWHADHAGLAPRLAERAGATIHMHERDAPLLADYAAARRERVRRDAATLAAWGVPESRIAAVRASDEPSGLPATTPVIAHDDGDAVAGGDLLHAPGHTEGHLGVRFGDALFVGDAVLPTYTPNVGGSDTRATDPLADYLATLDRLGAHHGTYYPGHGRTVAPERFDVIREHHAERARRVVEALRTRGPATPWTVARALFGELRGVHVKFGAGEAAAHLRSLATRGCADRIDAGADPETYALAGPVPPAADLLPD